MQHVPNSRPIDVTAQVSSAISRDVRGAEGAQAATQDARKRAKVPRLGKDRKSASTASSTQNPVEGSEEAKHSQRTRRYALQRTAGELVGGSVYACRRYRHHHHSADAPYPILKTADGSCHVAGLQKCSSVWACPVCAARIAQERKIETITALTDWRARGYYVYMLTLTLPHRLDQALKKVLEVLNKATRFLNSGRNSMKNLLDAYGYSGQIRAAEVTRGGNGWHPHLHVLVLTTMPVADELVDVLKARWEASVISQGWAAPNWECGATWQDGSSAAEYVNKSGTWGMAEEIAAHTSKKGKEGGKSPWELLQDAALGCEQSAALFKEYAAAFKGKRQVFWSAGLKDFFGLKDVSDVEIVEGETAPAPTEEQPVQVAEVAFDEYRLVCRYEQRAELLRAAEIGGQLTVDFLLTTLHERYIRDIRKLN